MQQNLPQHLHSGKQQLIQPPRWLVQSRNSRPTRALLLPIFHPLQAAKGRRQARAECIHFVYTQWRAVMRAKIQKWGNSLGIRLPKSVTVEAHLVEGSEVDITAAGGQIVITQASTKTYVLSDLLASYPDRKAPKEEEWGAPVGSEEW